MDPVTHCPVRYWSAISVRMGYLTGHCCAVTGYKGGV
jgi:hypothetical protein